MGRVSKDATPKCRGSVMAVPDRLRGFFASRRAVAVVALVCIALMLISVNIIAARLLAWRLDLTGEHLYTLSSGTREHSPGSTSRSPCASIIRPASPTKSRLTASMPSACARCSRNMPQLPTARSSSRCSTRCRSRLPRTAPSRSGCKACRSMQAASRSISVSPRPTRPTISRSSRSSSPSASASSNTI